MKLLTKIMVLIATVLVTSTTFAQNTQVSKTTKNDSISSKGFRVGIVKPMLRASAEATYNGESFHVGDNLDSALGVTLGYASLPVQELGWTTNVAYIDIQNDGTSTGLVRVDGNFAYAFTSIINLKGGLNFSKLTGSGSTDYDPGIGFQGGFGFQFNKNVGIDLIYTEMNQSRTSDLTRVDIKESGFEIGLNATF
ncbi:hypothetical protein [Bdellovibrio sp. HCB288]|uniref:hypothetical protein n=1 Tax=Bdellovibrio sp. HCB288 TaxID=3394355 RepID=UPI0039B5B1DD